MEEEGYTDTRDSFGRDIIVWIIIGLMILTVIGLYLLDKGFR